MVDKKLVGKLGEEFALGKLQELGYKILTKNYNTRLGEIDIIALDNDEIAFVEVKTRREGSLVSPEEAVNYKKQQKIIATAQKYMEELDEEYYWRFDVFEVFTCKDNPYEIKDYNHIISAFDSSER